MISSLFFLMRTKQLSKMYDIFILNAKFRACNVCLYSNMPYLHMHDMKTLTIVRTVERYLLLAPPLSRVLEFE